MGRSEPLSRTIPKGQSARANVVQQLGRVPLHFEPIAGDSAADAGFVSRGRDYTLWLTPTEAVVQLTGTGVNVAEPAVLRTVLVGANPEASVAGVQELPGRINRYQGNDPSKWRTNVPTYGKVRYDAVYRGIDLVYYGNQQQLEYDFEVAPGANPRAIQLRFEGADGIRIDSGGDLVIQIAGRELRQLRPVAFQQTRGGRREVASRYTMKSENEVGFDLGPYDDREALVIDPVLSYSTYFGGTGEERAFDIALDPGGNIYITGYTIFGTFPVLNAQQPVKPGPAATHDAFVTKFNPSGTALIYSTYLGGSRQDNNVNGNNQPGDIAVDAAGNAYITGDTNSSDFPVTPDAADSTYGTSASLFADAYYTKLGPTGTLAYSTYLGGTDPDFGKGIAVDASGNVYVTGLTRSSELEGFPQTANAFDGTLGGTRDAFLTKYNSLGVVVYSTFLGGSAGEGDTASLDTGDVALDAAGNAYVTGVTYSDDFPVTANARQPLRAGTGFDEDVFLSKINTTLSGAASLVYSTYHGGIGSDQGFGVAADAAGNAYVTGVTQSLNFPTVPGSFDVTFNVGSGLNDAFISKFNTNASGAASLVYSTYLGGTSNDFGFAIAVDGVGNAHVVGHTFSSNFPLVSPSYTFFAGLEPFVTKLNAAGSALIYSTYFGSNNNGNALGGVAVNAAGDTYVTGATNDDSPCTVDPEGFPLVNPFQATYGGGTFDAIVATIQAGGTEIPAVQIQLSAAALTVGEAVGNAVLTVTRARCSAGSVTVSYATSNGTATAPADYAPVSGTLTFGASETSKPIAIGIVDDTEFEPAETFTVTLSNVTGAATLGTPSSAVVTITDNDVQTFTISGRVRDLNGTGVASVTMTLTGSRSATTTTDAEGRYAFTGLAPGGTYTVTPTRAGFTITPANRTFASLSSNQVADFLVHPGIFTRYFAEGATGAFFDTSLALLNATNETAGVTVKYLRPDGVVLTQSLSLAPLTRATLNPETVSGLENAEFSTVIESNVPVITDRTMRWDARGYGSHAETSIAAPGIQWYLAEGATISGFNLFYLIQNPNATAAAVEVTYLLPTPAAPIVKTYTVAANSRFNIWVNKEAPALAAAEVSAAVRVTNNVPIIVERAMYLDSAGLPFGAGHESAAVVAPALTWTLAEGATGSYFDLFILVANPNATAAAVDARYLLPDGSVVLKSYTVTPNSRFNIWVDLEDARLANTAVSTTLTSTNGVPIVVERAMWWPGGAATWQEGHNSPGALQTGTKWGLADGEVGGAFATETYILIANTSAVAGPARVTLYFEDGTTAEKTFALNPTSRFNVAVAAEFSQAAGKRFGAIVESLGATPAQLVVERAMYSNAGGVVWAAGTNTLATRLQ